MLQVLRAGFLKRDTQAVVTQLAKLKEMTEAMERLAPSLEAGPSNTTGAFGPAVDVGMEAKPT